MNVFKILVLVSLLFTQNLFAQKKEITVWNYYLAYPFVISKNEGLAFDFILLLNEHFQNEYSFKLDNIPRARLNKYLQEDQKGLVLFVNWKWMGRSSKHQFLWSAPILQDKNIIISKSSIKLEPQGIDGFKDLTFGAIRGRKYNDFAALIEAGYIKKYLLDNEEQVLQMIAKDRVDFTTQPYSIATYLIQNLQLQEELYISNKSLFSYSRHIMFTKNHHEVHEKLETFINNLPNNPQWKSILKKYHL